MRVRAEQGDRRARVELRIDRRSRDEENGVTINTNDVAAKVQLTIFYSDKEPVGPYRVEVAARRTKHVRFNDLTDPAPVPLGTDYSCVIESDVPIVVQHTRLDSRQPANALMTTIAYPAGG